MELKAKELRIGNIIQWLHEESASAYVVNGEMIADIEAYNENPNSDRFARGFWYAAIPLTVDRLIEAGFKPIGKDGDYSKKGVIVHKRKRGWVIKKTIPIMKDFHQLQNYYYAVTGEEIVIPLFKNQ